MANRSNQPQTLKGFRDFLPERALIRQEVINTLRKVFAAYGFEPLETPALEYAETLLSKYGQEAEKLVYNFEDQGGRRVGLRYDLTVPTARVLAQYANQLNLPFKRYQIQPVWRAEKPQRGRFREFTQCDIDTFGATSPLADAEIIAIIYNALKKLGFAEFEIRINSRQVLFAILARAGVKDKEKQLSALQSIDKLDKKTEAEVKGELVKKGFSKEAVESIFTSIQEDWTNDESVKELLGFVENLQVPLKVAGQAGYRFDPTLARGLDYYTGPIFETVLKQPKVGSITGGGRYDKLISELGGPDIPATGTTFGLDRICEAVEELGLLKKGQVKPRVLLTIFPGYESQSLKLMTELQNQNIPCEVYLDPQEKMGKQLKYADRKGFDYAIIQGPDEVQAGQVTLKDLKNESKNNEERLTPKALVEHLSR